MRFFAILWCSAACLVATAEIPVIAYLSPISTSRTLHVAISQVNFSALWNSWTSSFFYFAFEWLCSMQVSKNKIVELYFSSCVDGSCEWKLEANAFTKPIKAQQRDAFYFHRKLDAYHCRAGYRQKLHTSKRKGHSNLSLLRVWNWESISAIRVQDLQVPIIP